MHHLCCLFLLFWFELWLVSLNCVCFQYELNFFELSLWRVCCRGWRSNHNVFFFCFCFLILVRKCSIRILFWEFEFRFVANIVENSNPCFHFQRSVTLGRLIKITALGGSRILSSKYNLTVFLSFNFFILIAVLVSYFHHFADLTLRF